MSPLSGVPAPVLVSEIDQTVFILSLPIPNSGSAGGWIQGGGHGALSNTYGLGVDRVIQFKVCLIPFHSET